MHSATTSHLYGIRTAWRGRNRFPYKPELIMGVREFGETGANGESVRISKMHTYSNAKEFKGMDLRNTGSSAT